MNVNTVNTRLERIKNSRKSSEVVGILQRFGFSPESVPSRAIEKLRQTASNDHVRLVVNLLNIIGTLFAIQAFVSSKSFIALGDTDLKCSIVKVVVRYILLVIGFLKWILKVTQLKMVYGTMLATVPAYNVILLKKIITRPIETADAIFSTVTKGNTKKLRSTFSVQNEKNAAFLGSAFLLGGLSNYTGASGAIETYINMSEASMTQLNNASIDTLKQIYSGTTYGLGMTGMRDMIDANISMVIKLVAVFAVVNIYNSMKVVTPILKTNPTERISGPSSLRIRNKDNRNGN
jgi:hypothetical protein